MKLSKLIDDLALMTSVVSPDTEVEIVQQETGEGFNIIKVVHVFDEKHLRIVVTAEK